MPILSVNNVVVGEAGGFAEFVVRLDAPLSKSISVQCSALSMLPPLATYGIASDRDNADFGTIFETLVFAPGETQKVVRVPIVDDTRAEDAEQFLFQISAAPASFADGLQFRHRTAHALIIDNDTLSAAPALYVDDAVVDEKDGVARFVVRLGELAGGAAASEVRVRYATHDGSAAAGQDYGARTGTLVFAPGSNVAVVEVPITDDTQREGVERFALRLSDAVGAEILDGEAVGEIGLSDGTAVSQPLLRVDHLVVSEGERYADLILRLSAPALAATAVNVSGLTVGLPTVVAWPADDLVFAPGETTLSARVVLAVDTRTVPPMFVIDRPDWQGPALAAHSVVGPGLPVPGKAPLTLAPTITVISNDTLVATPSVWVDDLIVDETSGQAVYVLRLGRHHGESSASPVRVDFATRDGSARAGEDYVASSGRAVFEPGESVVRVAVDLLDDALAEGRETFELVLSNAQGATLGDAVAAAEIGLSDGTPLARPLLSADDVVVDECTGLAQLVLRLSAPSPNVVTVDYDASLSDRGSGEARLALANVLGSSVVFAPGETVRTIPFTIVDDDSVEPVEQFSVMFSGAVNATLTRPVVNVLVRDNDRVVAEPSIRVEAPTVDERSATADFIVSLGARGGESATQPVTVAWHTVDGSARAGQDYVAASGVLRFEPGESVKRVPVALINDTSAEPGERFEIVLESPIGGTLLTERAWASIAASDGPPLTQPYLRVDDVVVSERDQYADLLVTLSEPSNVPLDFTLSLAGGTTDFADYLAFNPTTHVFAPGETVRTVRVMLVDDTAPEPVQHFVVSASPLPGGAIAAQATGTVTIVDNDGPVDLPQVVVRDAFVDEKAGLAQFVVQLGRQSGASANETVTLHWSTADATALAGQDYVAASGVLRFAPGESVQTVSVEINDDPWREAAERFLLVLSDATGAQIADGRAAGQIGASDTPAVARPGLSVSASRVAEGDGWFDLGLALDAPATELVRVGALPSVTGGSESTAIGTDYQLIVGQVAFEPGETFQSVRVSVVDDTVLESDEVLNIGALAIQGQTGTATAVAIGFVDDDDLSRSVHSHGRSDDVYRPGSAADVIVEGPGGGMDTVHVAWNVTLQAHLENAVLGGAAPLDATGNDAMNMLAGNAANNRLDGQGGIDTAVFASTRAAATIADGRVATPLDGSDSLVSIERLRFADVLLASDTTPGGHTWLASAMFNAGFDRNPDASERGRWTAQLDQLGNGRDLAQAMINFYAPGVPDDALVAHLWGTIVGTPITPADLAAYVGLLRDGTHTQASLLELVATLPLNTVEMAGIVGQVVTLDTAYFPLPG